MSELIHTCYRIGDIDRSVSFYEKLGFQEAGRMPPRLSAIFRRRSVAAPSHARTASPFKSGSTILFARVT